MSESRLNYKAAKMVQSMPHGHALKTHGAGYQRAGTPDILATVHGQMLALEGKLPGAKGLTELQRQDLLRWASAGALAGVYRSLSDVRRWIWDAVWETATAGHSCKACIRAVQGFSELDTREWVEAPKQDAVGCGNG